MPWFEKRAEKIVENSWRHGVYLDYWSFVHFLSGVMLALVFLIINIDTLSAFYISVGLLIVYEVFELIIEVVEDFQNALSDILIAVFSYILTYNFLYSLEKLSLGFILLGTSLLNLYLYRVGYRNFLKRRYREGHGR